MSETQAQHRDRLIDSAIRAAGSDDFGPATWQTGLEIYLDDLRTRADLNEVGVAVADDGIVGDLATRLRLQQWRTDHPQVADQEIRRPIVIVGQPRTATTILLDLMAQDPANRAPLSWEVEAPVPAPRTATYDDDPRIAQCQAQFDFVDELIPGFARFHELGARLAQEDVRIFTGDFKSMQHALQFEVPTYNHWVLHDADLSEAYAYHHRFLQHLQSEHAGERWLLKSPAHLWSLPQLLAQYPDAIIVQNHRDPLKVIASISALGASLREMTSDHVEVGRLAAQYSEDICLGLDRALEARRQGLFSEGQVIDIRYQDIRHDLLAAVGRLYDALGLELTDDAAARMRTFLEAHPGDPDGSLKRYRFADTGLDEARLRERVREYQEYFDVESETLD